MHRSIRVDNRLCYERDVQRRMREHRERLSAIRGRARRADRAGAPAAAFGHLRVNRKRRQMQEEEAERIERENRMLMARMHELVHAPSLSEGGAAPVAFAPGVVLGPNQNPVIDCRLPPASPNQQHGVRLGGSLNEQARRAEQRRVQRENRKMLRRLESRSPVHSSDEWRRHRQRTERFLRNMSSVTTAGHLPPPPRTSAGGRAPRQRAETSRRRLRTADSPEPTLSLTDPGPIAQADQGLPSAFDSTLDLPALPRPRVGRAPPLRLDAGAAEEGTLELMTADVQDDRATLHISVLLVLTRGGPSGAQPATSGVRVLAASADGRQRRAQLTLSVDNLKALSTLVGDDAVATQLDSLRLLDARGNYERPTDSWTPGEVEVLSTLVVRQLAVTVDDDDDGRLRLAMDTAPRQVEPVAGDEAAEGDGGGGGESDAEYYSSAGEDGPSPAASPAMRISGRRSLIYQPPAADSDPDSPFDSPLGSARAPAESPPMSDVDELAAFREQQALQQEQAELELQQAQKAMLEDAQDDFFPPCVVLSLDEAYRDGRVDGHKHGDVPVAQPPPMKARSPKAASPKAAAASPKTNKPKPAVFKTGRKFDSTYYTLRLQRATGAAGVTVSACGVGNAAAARTVSDGDISRLTRGLGPGPAAAGAAQVAWLRALADQLHVRTWPDGRPEFLLGSERQAVAHRFACVHTGRHVFVTLALGAGGEVQVQVNAFKTGVGEPSTRRGYSVEEAAERAGLEAPATVDAAWLARVARAVRLQEEVGDGGGVSVVGVL